MAPTPPTLTLGYAHSSDTRASVTKHKQYKLVAYRGQTAVMPTAAGKVTVGHTIPMRHKLQWYMSTYGLKV